MYGYPAVVSRLQTSGWGDSGSKLGPCSPLPLAPAAIRYTLSRPCHELTVMEFVKPKPGLVENLFLISGRHHWFLSPMCWGWGRPWSCSQLSALAAHDGGPPDLHCGGESGLPGQHSMSRGTDKFLLGDLGTPKPQTQGTRPVAYTC